MVPGARLELARCCHRRILSPLRLPIPPSRRSCRPESHKVVREYRRCLPSSSFLPLLPAFLQKNISIVFWQKYRLLLRPKACRQTRLLDESVFVPLQPFDASCPAAFPGIHRILMRPGLHKLPLLAAHAVLPAIAVSHVQAGTRNLPACPLRWLCLVADDLHGTGTKGGRDTRPQHLEIFVGPYGIDRAYGGIQVIHVGLHAAVIGVHFFRTRPAPKGFALAVDATGVTFPPLWKCPAEILGRDNVLPLHTK